MPKDISKIYNDKVSEATKFSERKEAKKLIVNIETGIISEIRRPLR